MQLILKTLLDAIEFLSKLLSIEGWESLFDRLKFPVTTKILKSTDTTNSFGIAQVVFITLFDCNRLKDHTIMKMHLEIEGNPEPIKIEKVWDEEKKDRDEYPIIRGKSQRKLWLTVKIPENYLEKVKLLNDGRPHPFRIILSVK